MSFCLFAFAHTRMHGRTNTHTHTHTHTHMHTHNTHTHTHARTHEHTHTHTHTHTHLAFLLAAMREGLAGLCMGFAGRGAHVLVIKTHSHAYTITHNTHTSKIFLSCFFSPSSLSLPSHYLWTTQTADLSLSLSLSLCLEVTVAWPLQLLPHYLFTTGLPVLPPSPPAWKLYN